MNYVLYFVIANLVSVSLAFPTVCEWNFDSTANSINAGCSPVLWYTFTSGNYEYYTDPYFNGPAIWGNSSYLRVPVDVPANGGGSYVNSYSLTFWLYVTSIPANGFPIFNTACCASNNAEIRAYTDGSLCAPALGQCTSPGVFAEDRWYRFGISVNRTTAKLYFRDQVLKTFTGIVLDSDYSLFTYTASTPWFSLFGAQNTAYSVYTADVLFYGTAALSDAQMITNLASPPISNYEWDFTNTFYSIADATPIQTSRGNYSYEFEYDSYLNKVVLNSIDTVYLVPSNSQANGGGNYVNSYTIIFDIKIPSTTATWVPLLSTESISSGTLNQRPVLAVKRNGAISIHREFNSAAGTIPFDTWVQIALTADVTDFSLRVFLNKQLVLTGYCDDGQDSTCALYKSSDSPNGYFLFGDDLGNIGNVVISKLRYWDDWLTDLELMNVWGPLLNMSTASSPSTTTSTSTSTTTTTASTSSSSSSSTSATTATTASTSSSSGITSSSSGVTTGTTSSTTSDTVATSSSASSSSAATTSGSTSSDSTTSTSSTSSSTTLPETVASTSTSSSSSSDSTSSSTTETPSTSTSSTSANTTYGAVSGSPASLNKQSTPSSNGQTGVVAGISVAIGIIVLLFIIAGLVFFIRKRKQDKKDVEDPQLPLEQQLRNSTINMQILSNVVIGKKLGGGNFGEVYRGTWDGSEVACKKVSQDQAEEFRREANLLIGLQHPNVIRLLGLYIDNTGDHYMVMELVTKGSLKNLFKKEKDLKIVDMFDMMISTCKGMVYLESKGIIHRDLACRNILVSHINGKYSCLVADFGLSRETSEYKAEGALIPIRWAAPEVLKKMPVTSKSDVFSFGILMHEIMTYGAPPYEFLQTNREVIEYVCEGQRLPQLPSCPDDLYAIMRKCWKEEPSERPSFKEILDMLTAMRGEEKPENASPEDSHDSEEYKMTNDVRKAQYSNTVPNYQDQHNV